MTGKTGTDAVEIARQMGALANGMVEAQDIALRVLQAEMVALATLLPGTGELDEATRAALQAAHEAEVEDNFDNMPL